jgi:uncharacterized damage-inducible protein DinB
MAHAGPVRPLLELLEQMRTTIERLDDCDYSRPAPGRSSGGVGGHVRHCLDHVSALLTATRTGLCTYDRRQRGTKTETCRVAAMSAISDVTRALMFLASDTLETEVYVETQIDPSGATIVTRSSIGRELAFVASHTIHHNAIVAQMMRTRGLTFTPRFDLAPATPTDAAPSLSRSGTAPGVSQTYDGALTCAP